MGSLQALKCFNFAHRGEYNVGGIYLWIAAESWQNEEWEKARDSKQMLKSIEVKVHGQRLRRSGSLM